jgi:hypothetical protein
MADEAQNQDGGAPPDEKAPRSTESVAAELNRKTDKLAAENQALAQKLEQALALITQQNNANRQPQGGAEMTEEQLADLSYSDPKAYAREVSKRAEQRASALIDARLNQQNQTQVVMGQLINDYPELGDTNSPLSKKAVEIYNQLPNEMKSNPIAYRTAVRDAAAEEGLLPKSKRKSSSNDDFSLGGSNGTRGNPKKDAEIDARTLEMAERMGLNITDKKVAERLKQRSQRKNWGKFE